MTEFRNYNFKLSQQGATIQEYELFKSYIGYVKYFTLLK